jgi:hypothetical protein
MKFKQYENGTCDIEFSWKERLILIKKGKLHLTEDNLRHFGNHLLCLVAEWNEKFKESTKKIKTFKDTEVKTK